MAGSGTRFGGGRSRDAIRVQATKFAGYLQPEYKNFSIDPEITSFEMLQLLLMQAFQLKSEFTISYLSKDDEGDDVFLALLSDWDLDAAIFCASDPCLRLRIDAKPFEGPGILEGWDVIGGQDVPQENNDRNKYVPFVGSLVSQVGRTFTRVQRIFQTVEEESAKEDAKYELPKPPLDDQEFLTYLDYLGRLTKPNDLRLRVYQGGVEPSLRKVVWRHLLNIYPEGMTGTDRLDYVRRKISEYEKLKRKLLADNREEYVNIKNMVMKDVSRTDRQEDFFAGDENPNSTKLFNILTTFSLSHPDVSYCQGMSDLAAPILYVLQDEAQTYICFCSLMKRVKGNFSLDGKAMSIKFLHLTELIRCVDPEFYEYLVGENADDLYFCYRWLLLELKREFAFQDALRMLEIMWSSLPPDPPSPILGVELEGPPCQNSPSAYSVDRLRFKFSLKHQPSRESLDGAPSPNLKKDKDHFEKELSDKTKLKPPPAYPKKDENPEIPKDEGQEKYSQASSTEPLKPPPPYNRGDSHELSHKSLPPYPKLASISKDMCGCTGDHCENCRGDNLARDLSRTETKESLSHSHENNVSPHNSPSKLQSTNGINSSKISSLSLSLQCDGNTNSSNNMLSPLSDREPTPSSPALKRNLSALSFKKTVSPFRGLPSPQDFGGGNPFMMFICVSLLLEQRERIMTMKMDFNEMAMLFDRMVRKQNLNRILYRARNLYSQYLQSEAANSGNVMVKGGNSIIQDNSNYNLSSPTNMKEKPLGGLVQQPKSVSLV